MDTQHLRRPPKVLWVFPDISVDWIKSVPSKSTRRLIQHLSVLLEKNNLDFQWSLPSEQQYLDWHRFYSEVMAELDHEVIAQPEWYSKKMLEGKTIHLLECKNRLSQTLVGGAIVVQTHDNRWTAAYKATRRIDVVGEENASLGLLFDIEFMTFAQAHKPTTITAGASRNAFGYINTMGYLLSKLRQGYLPTISMKYVLQTDFPQASGTPTIWFVRDEMTQDNLFLLSHSQDQYSQEFFHFCDVQKIPYKQADIAETETFSHDL